MNQRRNKFLLMLCSSVFLVMFALGISSCGGGNCAGCFGEKPQGDGHRWVKQEVLQENTCIQDGAFVYSCKDCGKKKTEIVKATGHNYGKWTIVKEADCFVQGEQICKCSTCGEEITKNIPKTEHTYEIEGKETINGIEYTQYICGLCTDSFTVQNALISADVQAQEAQYVFGCASDFTFDVICSEGEEYLRNNLRIVDAYYDGSEYETNENAICDYTIEETEESVWRIAPVENYKAGYSYKAKRSGGVIFKDYGVQDVTFYIEKEETNVVELNEGVIFLQTLENTNPGYYPYTTEYSEESGRYWLTLGKTEGLQAGDIICVGTAESLDDVLNGEVGENLFGEIISIKRPIADGDYLLELKYPNINELFGGLDIYNTSMKPIVGDDFNEQLEAQAVKSLYESDSFAEFLAATYQGSTSYLAKNNLTTPVNKLDKLLDCVEITPHIPNFAEDAEIDNFTIGVEIKGSVKIPIYEHEFAEEKLGDIIVYFYSTMSMKFETLLVFRWGIVEISNEEEIPEDLEGVNFLFTLTQTTTTEFRFYFEITADEEATGELKDEVAAVIKNGNLDEMKTAIKEVTKELTYEEVLDIGKGLKKEPLLKIPLGSSGCVLEFKLDLYTEFDLYAAFNYDYKLVTVNTYGVQLGKDFILPINSKQVKENTNKITMVGYMYMEAGLIGHFTLATRIVPSEELSVGIDAKVGPYVEVTGAGYWDFAGSGEDNFLKGEIEAGIHYDIDAVYTFFGLEKKIGNKLDIFEDKIVLEYHYGEYIPGDNSSNEDISYKAVVEYRNNKYYLYDVSMNWLEAKAFCEELGGHLVVITSEDEQKAVEGLLEQGAKKQYWLGAENAWEWITGELIDYANWDDSEPNNMYRDSDGEMETYAQIYNEPNPVKYNSERFKWNDTFYDNTYKEEANFFSLKYIGFICEIEGSHSDDEGEQNASVGLEYELSDDGTYYIVTGIGECTDKKIIIPSVHNGKPVKEIGNSAFHECERLIEITIPNSVTYIGPSAFAGCGSLTKAIIGDGVTHIEEFVFSKCKSLTNVIIGDGATSIDSFAFYYCTQLKSVIFGENSQLVRIEAHAFEYCEDMARIAIPNTVTEIGTSAFYGCNSLTEITIPDSVTYIGPSAFASCEGLINVIIGDGVTCIEGSAFSHCKSLTNVTIGNRVTSINSYVFNNCEQLKIIRFNGTISQWYAIEKDSDWNYKISTKEVICSDGTVTL